VAIASTQTLTQITAISVAVNVAHFMEHLADAWMVAVRVLRGGDSAVTMQMEINGVANGDMAAVAPPPTVLSVGLFLIIAVVIPLRWGGFSAAWPGQSAKGTAYVVITTFLRLATILELAARTWRANSESS
jgi:hypothetical protein